MDYATSLSMNRETDDLPISVEASLQFTKRGGKKPYVYAGEPPLGVPATRGEYEYLPVTIENLRNFADKPLLDREGFAVIHHPSAVENLLDEAQAMTRGRAEAADIIKSVTGASRVVVFDHTIRRRSNVADYTPGFNRQPAALIHADQTIASGPKRLQEVLGAEAASLHHKRTAIINVWRPIGHPARDYPLVLGDARTFPMPDFIGIDRIYPDRRGETYGIAYNPAHRWFYVPDLRPEEAILIKCWDSDQGVARFAPHGAFQDPTTPSGTPPRQSIEFRTIAIFD